VATIAADKATVFVGGERLIVNSDPAIRTRKDQDGIARHGNGSKGIALGTMIATRKPYSPIEDRSILCRNSGSAAEMTAVRNLHRAALDRPQMVKS
jgi:hypothetical protein